ncbi:MAG: hypothetical protein MMC23_002244 [Stictis urceolatum]|nr:hypothetical protein [Stictis urceolata]
MFTNFSKTSRNIRVFRDPQNSPILEAECHHNESYILSTLDLDGILGNDDGHFRYGWARFGASSSDLRLEGSVLSAALRTVKGQNRRDTFDLDTIIGNINGQLKTKLLEGTVQKVAGSFKCNVCRDFSDTEKAPVIKAEDVSVTRYCSLCAMLKDVMDKLGAQHCQVHRSVGPTERSGRGQKPAPEDTVPSIKVVCHITASETDKEFKIYNIPGKKLRLELSGTQMLTSVDQVSTSRPFLSLQVRPYISGNSASSECTTVVKRWISDCVQDHDKCRSDAVPPKPSRNFLRRAQNDAVASIPKQSLPSRVLYLGSSASDPLRLQDTPDQTATYACLSHCWGGQLPFTLTLANRDALHKAIPWFSLPPTFQDAITFCRQLSIPYLWIDALCIIQDSDSDWAHESTQMASYYGNSHITLAATSSPSHSSGCRISTPPLRYSGTGPDNSPYAIHLQPLAAHINSQSPTFASSFPLLTRAWVYQERRLAPRVLHFCTDEVFFECATRVHCECDAPTTPLDISAWTKARETFFATHYDLNELKDVRQRVQHEWHAYVRAYSSLELTFARDRLPALSGLARRERGVREGHGVPTGRYLAGLWEGEEGTLTLLNGMTWCVGKSLDRVHKSKENWSIVAQTKQRKSAYAKCGKGEVYFAPSWSWASVLDPVQYHPFGYDRGLCEVLAAETTPVHEGDEFGQVSAGYLMLKAKLLESAWAWCQKWGNTAENMREPLLTDVRGARTTIPLLKKDHGMKFWPDYDFGEGAGEFKFGDEERLFLMPLVMRKIVGMGSGAEIRIPGMAVTETLYLVLRRAKGEAVPVFRRVGWSVHWGKGQGPDMGAAKETKFMLV